mgnify:CR=1 FL=1
MNKLVFYFFSSPDSAKPLTGMEERERNKTRLQDLPDEVLFLILQELDPLSLFVISLVYYL